MDTFDIINLKGKITLESFGSDPVVKYQDKKITFKTIPKDLKEKDFVPNTYIDEFTTNGSCKKSCFIW
jgi:hypothetical protein